MNEAKQKLIVVLGMHRSGTSAITRGLQALGVNLGDKLVASGSANKKGYYEDSDIYLLNEKILKKLHSSWHSLSIIPFTSFEYESLSNLKLQAIQLLQTKMANGLFGLKDPRIPKLLPFWELVFEELNIEPLYVVAFRHPMSVAKSLQNRDGFDNEKSYYLWLEHVIPSILHTSESNRIVVNFDLLITNPALQLGRIAEKFNLPFYPDSDETKKYIHEFLDDSLQHSKFELKDFETDLAVPKPVISCYTLLTRLAQDETDIDDANVKETFEQLHYQLQLISPALNYMTRCDEKISEQLVQIQQRDAQIVERDAKIDECNSQIIERDDRITDIFSSTSWRVTRPIRWMKERLLLLSQASHNQLSMLDTYSQSPSFSGRNKKELDEHHQLVDIIVCVHNALEDVKRCLESIISNTNAPYHLIIVDDGSNQETKSYLECFAPENSATLIRNAEATGYTKAANTGMRASKGDFVVLLNSDTIVPLQWLDRLVQCANSSDKIGMVGPLSNTASWQSVPQITDGKGDWAENPLPKNWSVQDFATEVTKASPRIYPCVGFLNGFCLLIKRSLIDDIGLFDEETFARGYGEENDYSLRATENGWQLAVADDCYVYHAQSKSYSHERRKELADLAGKALANKHGQQRIDDNLSMTSMHPALVYMRNRCTEIKNITDIRAAGLRFTGKKILFLLPVSTAGGGGNIVLLEAQCMREMGCDVQIANLEENRILFEKNHPDINLPVLYFNTPEQLVEKISKTDSKFDAVIATLYSTVFWLSSFKELTPSPLLGYYIQDFEPYFFQSGSDNYQFALASYTLFPELRLITKTKWTQEAVLNNTGVSPIVIGPTLDVDKFHPSSTDHSQTDIINILAMVRPSCSRRGPEMTMKVLRHLKLIFDQRIRIIIFGVDSNDIRILAYPRDFLYINLGVIPSQDVAIALSNADIFLDCSTFQAMGLTAMEAMASGVAVVGPIHGGLKEIITDGHNGLLVDTLDENEIISKVSELINNNQLREKIQLNALDVLTHSPFYSSFKILDYFFPEI